MEKIATKEIPENPGIYIFKDKYNDPLYVGKAKNLRKRVPSYFRENTTWKIKRLTSEATEISFITSKMKQMHYLLNTHLSKNINQNIMYV